jgi:hypothetical protein
MRTRGLRVSGHVPAFMRASQAVAAGVDELQHINQLMLNFVSDPDTDSRALARFTLVGERTQALDLDSPAVRDFIALLAARGTVVDATIAVFEGMFNQRQGEMNPSLAAVADHVPFATQRDWRGNSMDVTEANLAIYRASYAKMIRFIGCTRPACRWSPAPTAMPDSRAPRARTLRAGRHDARRGDPHRDPEWRALYGARTDGKRPVPRADLICRWRPDGEHLRHPPRQLRAEGRRGLCARGHLRVVRRAALCGAAANHTRGALTR